MKRSRPLSYAFSSRLFLRLLALTFLIAFVSWGVQADGLVGGSGIRPAAELLKAARGRWGPKAYWALPSFLWASPTDGFLKALWVSGSAISFLALLGWLQGPAFLALWSLYLSLVSTGGEFMSFQWDSLLLETGLLACLLAPWEIRPAKPRRDPPRPALWLLWWLLFRLMFESGCVKLMSGDPSWRNLTALEYHYQTQPLPTWVAWYAQRLPAAFQKLSVLAVFLIELAAPFLIFIPAWPRRIAALLFVFLQLLIAATGNYCFFNLLAIALSLLLLDDGFWALLKIRKTGDGKRKTMRPLFYAPFFILGSFAFLAFFPGPRALPGPIAEILEIVSPLRSFNAYGLFAVMTTARREIVVEGSRDGKSWKEYPFRWKPDDPARRPRFVAPHQPRLDWQMWFAALSPWRANFWFLAFLSRILEGSPSVLALLKENPFPGRPPKYVRALFYEYRFTSLAERRKSGAWWERKLLGLYAPVISKKPQGNGK